ncbi:acyl carrier protein [Hydrobacter penzbergensis]|uniref:Acyl carrier protein n=2 Tax=Hydrobacter penzbergensis TaxID=1235997 RepID=A0A8X8IFD2_9BACT|nr:acyl carrier protein [Hydrobacter penzbergensis]
MADVFLIDESNINENSSPETIEQWDSIGHLNLVTSLEEAFGVIFDEEQIIQMLNFKLVVVVVEEAVGNK